MAGKQRRRPKPTKKEQSDPKGFINGFEKNPEYEKKGMFLEECFEDLRSAKRDQIYITFPVNVSEEERAYVVQRLRVVHWNVAVEGNRMKVTHASRRADSFEHPSLPLAASDHE